MRLFKRQPSARRVPDATLFAGRDTLEVVGESFYQDALWQLVGGFCSERVSQPCRATLLPEPTNPYDKNAVEVLIDGHLVGHLSREDAVAYAPGLSRLMAGCATGHVALEGVIAGGGPREGGRIGYLGVFLHHDPVQFGVAPHYTAGGRLRTGLSEAIATDLADDSYDLSWLLTLSTDDTSACQQLHSLLQTEDELIDRHFMFCELEARLYRLRRGSASVLADFDAMCELHHSEMASIRTALFEKFEVVPMIEMYRQAAIRWQQAKQWDAVRDWSERGLTVYGDNAARPEAVADLEKRHAHALEKLAPTPAKSAKQAAPASSRTPIIEALTCTGCGRVFERTRSRGRKPKLCPNCRPAELGAAVTT
jgi:hypothetical protein